jgi:hypothetical protein
MPHTKGTYSYIPSHFKNPWDAAKNMRMLETHLPYFAIAVAFMADMASYTEQCKNPGFGGHRTV